MLKRFLTHPFQLTYQIVISIILVVVLAAAAIAIPAIWLIRDQLTKNTWEMVEHGAQTTAAVYAGKLKDLDNLALLTAQRPTLHQLLEENQPNALGVYLATFRAGAGLSVVAVCSPEGVNLAQSGLGPGSNACSWGESTGYWVDSTDAKVAIQLVSSQPLETDAGMGGRIIVGSELDPAMMEDISVKTGFEQIFLVNGQPEETSFDDSSLDWGQVTQASHNGQEKNRFQFSVGDEVHFAKRIPLGGEGIEAIVALPGDELIRAQQQLVRTIGGGLVVVIGLGALAGVLIARRISYPLDELHKAAIKFRKGDLGTPVSIPGYVSEVATVGFALEDARINLRYSINELQHEKAWTEHLLKSIVEGIITLDRQDRITYFSQGAERLTGWETKDVLGRAVDEVLETLDKNTVFSQLVPSPGRQKRIVITRKDGRNAVLAVTGAELAPPEAGRARVVLVIRDVSEEEAIHQFLGGFLANITHEFRTPLSSLAASIELLMDQLPDLSAGELEELLLSLHLGVINLQTLIDNLLEGSSIEAGRFRVSPRPSDFTKILEDATRLMTPLYEKYGQQLTVQIPEVLPMVNVDTRRTVQVLVNLLSNAVKFSAPGNVTKVWVDNQVDCIRVEVSDQGTGIPGLSSDTLFQQFGPNFSGEMKQQHGIGLGLSVVKAIIEAQGGAVGVYSRPEGGTTFWFSLPLEFPEEGRS